MSSLTLDAAALAGWIGAFLLPFFRIAALFAVMPVLGGREVPVRVRVGLAAALTALVLPTLDTASMPSPEPFSGEAIALVAQQLAIGLATGLMVLVVFNAVTLAGESIAITMGLGFALMNDPANGVQVPTVSQFYMILATLLFLALDAHHAVLELLVASFERLPIGAALGEEALVELLFWGGTVFHGALAIALPALVAMLAANMVMGVMTRAAPQLNLFSVGFPITMTVGFIALLATLGSFGESVERLLAELMPSIAELLER